jgi:hypothetical protein
VELFLHARTMARAPTTTEPLPTNSTRAIFQFRLNQYTNSVLATLPVRLHQTAGLTSMSILAT